MKTWFITGAGSGLGYVIAEEALSRGDRVAVTARAPEKAQALVDKYPQTALALPLDVLDSAAVARTVEKVVDWSGRIDVLVNNAGRGIHGAVEEVSDAEAREAFDLNVFALLTVTRAVLPVMRRQRSGRVFNLSSAAGLAGDAGLGLYAATKFAVEGLSEALAQEGAPLGIQVTVLEPGPFRTEFAGRSLIDPQTRIADYAATAGKRSEMLKNSNGAQPGDPKKAAKLICDVADMEQQPLHLCIGPASYARVRDKIEKLVAEMADWESRATVTNY